MVTSSALLMNPADNEPDWRVVYYEFDLEAVGPSWDSELAAVQAFQDAMQNLGS